MRLILSMISVLLLSTPAFAGEDVEYTDSGTVLQGYWNPAGAECETAKATVIIAHQWMGITEYEKTRADMLSKRCYNAFVADVYGKGVRPKNVDEAGKAATIYKNDPTLARSRMNAAFNKVKGMKGVDDNRIHVIGYCFGGTMALELARSGAAIKSAHSFHGGLATKNPKQNPLRPRIFIHHGAEDPFVPAAEVSTFLQEMAKAEADLTFYQYPQAVHAFTQPNAGNDPKSGVAYNIEADGISWQRFTDYLDRASQ